MVASHATHRAVSGGESRAIRNLGNPCGRPEGSRLVIFNMVWDFYVNG